MGSPGMLYINDPIISKVGEVRDAHNCPKLCFTLYNIPTTFVETLVPTTFVDLNTMI